MDIDSLVRRRRGAGTRRGRLYGELQQHPHMKHAFIALAIGAVAGYFAASTIKTWPGFSQINDALNPNG